VSRLDELIQLAIDGNLTDEDAAELQQLVEDDESARHTLVSSLDTEAMLRGLDDRFDVSDRTVAALAMAKRREPESNATSTDSTARRAPRSHERSRWRLSPVPLAVAATVVLAAIVFIALVTRPPEPIATLSFARGEVRIERGDETIDAVTGAELFAADRLSIRTPARVTYVDGTTLDCRPDSVLHLSPDEGAVGKHVALTAGGLNADVRPQPSGEPMVFVTPHATTRVVGTRLHIGIETDKTRVRVDEGLVRVSKPDAENEAEAVEVTPEHQVVAKADDAELEVRPTRVDASLLTLYDFAAGIESTGGATPIRLRERGTATKRARVRDEGGLRVDGGMLVSEKPADPIVEACRLTNELTVEAWVTPEAAKQAGPARIFAMCDSSMTVNFILGHGGNGDQLDDTYVFRLHTTRSGRYIRLRTEAGSAGTGLIHIVATRDADGRCVVYLNGEPHVSDKVPGTFDAWSENLALAIGGDPGEVRPWRGVVHLAAIYNASLTEQQVRRNFEAGFE